MVSSQSQSNFDEKERYILPAFDKAHPFSSFLPGIAGQYGIPLWVFYNNRGQAISSFGIESKDKPIMEFQSANKAYQLTSTLGFRTFLKGDNWQAEPFSPYIDNKSQRDMFIGMNEIEIRETDQVLGLETSVRYFTLLNEPFGGLVRQVTFRNLQDKTMAFEVLDGMPALIPYGVDNRQLKHIGRTIEAWMEVFHLEDRQPFYRLRASAEDTSDIQAIESGNFAMSVADGELLQPFVDPVLVFGSDTAFSFPQNLIDNDLGALSRAEQITEGRTPCAFFGKKFSLAENESKSMVSIFGFVTNSADLQQVSEKLLSPNYIQTQYKDAQELCLELTQPIATKSGSMLFDAYSRQTFLDNVMRGGWPVLLGGKHVYHVYSRKHGDPERDYNYFFLAPEKFSQGNGSFRDVNQNRRNDVFFEPRTIDFNIRLFMSLIQTDGYNPLVIEGTTFTLPTKKHGNVLKQVKNPDRLKNLLSGSFSPGSLLNTVVMSDLQIPEQDFLELVMGDAKQEIQAAFGEGYWVDHWTYNLDLIEAFLNIYPDKKEELLFDSEPLPFYDSPAVVKHRIEKYVLDKDQPRQFNAISEDEEKAELIANRKERPNWVRTNYGKGEIFTLPLFSKLVLLALVKFTTRDPSGMGIEMEAGRPGWYDALNGLPGIFGSSLPESFELLRLINFILETLQATLQPTTIPAEAYQLLQEVLGHLDKFQSDFEYWDAVSTSRETYREKTRLGVSGDLESLSNEALLSALEKMKASLQAGIDRALQENNWLSPTYISHQITEYEELDVRDSQGRPFIRPLSFTYRYLPFFLEGPVRHMKVMKDKEVVKKVYQKVRDSDLFDEKLKMYKLNASLLEEPHDIGRARAFSPGWLENESIWLHMSYKYLLEVLKAGLFEQFFEDMQTSMPFLMDPLTYGRSPLENSSFIVSSAHPDESLHGRGFVARLSGSTAEFLSIWRLMMAGPKPFSVEEGTLKLSLRPALPGWLFPQDGKLTFNFLGHCEVTYHNPDLVNTFDPGIISDKIVLHLVDGTEETIHGSIVPQPYASMAREGKIPSLDIYYKYRGTQYDK